MFLVFLTAAVSGAMEFRISFNPDGKPEMKTWTSSDGNVSFDYPATWGPEKPQKDGGVRERAHDREEREEGGRQGALQQAHRAPMLRTCAPRAKPATPQPCQWRDRAARPTLRLPSVPLEVVHDHALRPVAR